MRLKSDRFPSGRRKLLDEFEARRALADAAGEGHKRAAVVQFAACDDVQLGTGLNRPAADVASAALLARPGHAPPEIRRQHVPRYEEELVFVSERIVAHSFPPAMI